MFPLLMKYNILLIISFGRQTGRAGWDKYKAKSNIIMLIKHVKILQSISIWVFSFNLVKIATLEFLFAFFSMSQF